MMSIVAKVVLWKAVECVGTSWRGQPHTQSDLLLFRLKNSCCVPWCFHHRAFWPCCSRGPSKKAMESTQTEADTGEFVGQCFTNSEHQIQQRLCFTALAINMPNLCEVTSMDTNTSGAVHLTGHLPRRSSGNYCSFECWGSFQQNWFCTGPFFGAVHNDLNCVPPKQVLSASGWVLRDRAFIKRSLLFSFLDFQIDLFFSRLMSSSVVLKKLFRIW